MKSPKWHMGQFGCPKGVSIIQKNVKVCLANNTQQKLHGENTYWNIFILKTMIKKLSIKYFPLQNKLSAFRTMFCLHKPTFLLWPNLQTLDWTSRLIDMWTLARVSSFELSESERPWLWWEINSIQKTAAGGLCSCRTLSIKFPPYTHVINLYRSAVWWSRLLIAFCLLPSKPKDVKREQQQIRDTKNAVYISFAFIIN